MSTTAEWPADWLPKEVVEFRRALMDELWDTWHIGFDGLDEHPERVGDDYFTGTCFLCRGHVRVILDDEAPQATFEPIDAPGSCRCGTKLLKDLGLRTVDR